MLTRKLAHLVNRLLRSAGIELRRILPPAPSEDNDAIYARVKNLSATSRERVFALCDAVGHAVESRVPGAFVECGVWRGGSSMVAALALLRAGAGERELHLFDTFEGMPSPTDHDREASTGKPALHEWNGRAFCYAPIEEVRANMITTGYDMARVHFHKGMVEETIPRLAPERIAVLRLDTDWYASTKHELEWL